MMKYDIDHIIQNYSSSLFKICLGYSDSFHDAQDLLQEVFVNIWKGLDSFREEAHLKTWLYRIAVNTCLLKLRKKTIKTINIDNIDFDWILYNPFENHKSESFEVLHQLIQELKPKDKLIILLYLEGCSHHEIANIVGITANYVGVKMSRIKQILSNKINQNG